MSAQTRKELAFWIMLLLGTFLNGFQIYKYATNTLEYRYEELIILIIGVAFNFAPRFLLNLADKIVNKKVG